MDISPTNNFISSTNMTGVEWYEEAAPISEEAWNMLKSAIRDNCCVVINLTTQQRVNSIAR